MGEVAEVTQEKLPPMPQKSAFTFHHNFYPKPKKKIRSLIFSDEIKKNCRYLNKIIMI